VIIDRKTVVVQSKVAHLSNMAVFSSEPVLVEFVQATFDMLWESSKILSDSTDDPSISPRQLSILRIMGTKSTDSAIAKALNLSPRTVHREIAELYQRTETETRFRLGVEAQKRGWLNN
jgi:DNA-binding NarL/FixJ family response regulator